MNWLNYQHLYYFWTVAKEGTVSRACKVLRLAQPTVSSQIKVFEESIGHKLFRRAGRNMVLTETGRIVFRYADEIFSIGGELLATLQGRPESHAPRLRVGVADILPKYIVYRLLEPALTMREPTHLVCVEGKTPDLLAKLAVHELDLIITDEPVGPSAKVKAYNHPLGESGVTVYGRKDFASRYGKGFPQSLDGAPFLLQTPMTWMRSLLDAWFKATGIRPRVVGEFEDSALLKAFGQAGHGLFAAPTVIEAIVVKQYGVQVVGRLPEARESYYAITVERKVTHPAVNVIANTARGEIFRK